MSEKQKKNEKAIYDYLKFKGYQHISIHDVGNNTIVLVLTKPDPEPEEAQTN